MPILMYNHVLIDFNFIRFYEKKTVCTSSSDSLTMPWEQIRSSDHSNNSNSVSFCKVIEFCCFNTILFSFCIFFFFFFAFLCKLRRFGNIQIRAHLNFEHPCDVKETLYSLILETRVCKHQCERTFKRIKFNEESSKNFFISSHWILMFI